MKTLIFYICTFALVSFTVGLKLGSRNQHYDTCLTENNASDDDMFTLQNILDDKHKQSENQEKLKKNGCVMQCLLQKEGMMEGSEYNIEKIRSEFIKRTNAPSDSKMFEALNNCINETKDLTEKCEKSFAFTECIIKAEERAYPSESSGPNESVSKLGSRHPHYSTCLTELNVSDDDMLTMQDIFDNKYKSESQEKLKKNGCVLQCMLQKDGLMEGSEYDVEKILASPYGNERMGNCLNKTKDLTEKCEKSFALMECFLTAKRNFFRHLMESKNQEA